MSLPQRLRDSLHWPSRLHWLQPWVVIFGGFLVHLSLGSFYTFGNMAPYIASYIRNRSHPSDLKFATTSWVFALNFAGEGASMFLGGLLARRITPRWSTLVGSLLMSIGVALSHFAIRVSFFLLLVTYGALVGLGIGIAYIGPIMCAMGWLPKWKGVASGVVVSGFGLGALIFDAVQTAFINPENYPPGEDDTFFTNDELLDRVPFVFLILGGSYAVMQIIGSLLLFNPPPELASPRRTRSPSLSPSPAESAEDGAGGAVAREVSPTRAEIDTDMSVSTDDGEQTPSFVTSDIPSIASKEGEEEEEEGEGEGEMKDENKIDDGEKWLLLSSKELQIEEGVNSLQSFRGAPRKGRPRKKQDQRKSKKRRKSWTRNVIISAHPCQMIRKTNFYILYLMFFFFGIPIVFTATLYKFFALTFIMNDRFLAIAGSIAAIFNCLGRIGWGLLADKVSYKFALVILSSLMTAFLLTFYTTSAGGEVMFFIWLCLLFFCIGGSFSLFPTAVARCFGPKYFGANYGILFTSQIISSVLTVAVSQVLQEYLPWYGIMFLMSGFTFLGMVLALLYRPKRFVMLSSRESTATQYSN